MPDLLQGALQLRHELPIADPLLCAGMCLLRQVLALEPRQGGSAGEDAGFAGDAVTNEDSEEEWHHE